jgi:hypothetical protein
MLHCVQCAATLREINQKLAAIQKTLGVIVTTQDEVNAADTAMEGEIADLATKDEAIAAAQAQLLATIQGLQGAGVDTTKLVADTAALLQAQGADDATVAALTAAAAPAAPAPDAPPAS